MNRVGVADAKRAGEYIDALGFIEATAEQDRELIGAWAEDVPGLILDVGCGPGHWTAWLDKRGHDIEGVDPVPLHVEDACLGGILAWYSLIHTDPADVPAMLGEFARALTPDGSLALGFFDGPVVAAFDHAVTTAYVWPIDALAQTVEEAGFTVTVRHTRTDPGARPHGAITARRTPPGSH